MSKDLVGPTCAKYFRPQSRGSQRPSRGLACGAPPSMRRAERSVGLAPAGVRSRRSAGLGNVAGQARIRPPVPGLVVEQALVGCVTLVRVTSRRCRSAMGRTRVNSATLCLLRRSIPRGTGSSMHGALDLAAVALALDTTSRKTLGWRAPGEAPNAQLRSDHTQTVRRQVASGPPRSSCVARLTAQLSCKAPRPMRPRSATFHNSLVSCSER